MEALGKELEFISLIKRDGSGVVPVPSPWTSESPHAKTDDMSYLDDTLFTINIMSLSCGTYIASGFNTWVVKLKNPKKRSWE